MGSAQERYYRAKAGRMAISFSSLEMILLGARHAGHHHITCKAASLDCSPDESKRQRYYFRKGWLSIDADRALADGYFFLISRYIDESRHAASRRACAQHDIA